MAAHDPTGLDTQPVSGGGLSATSAVHRDPSDVVRLYSRVARAYEAWATIADSRVRRLVRDAVRQSGAGSIVEAGCGTGALLIKLALDNPDGHTVGLDLAPGMVAAAQRRIERLGLSSVEACCCDIQNLGLADATVDTVTSSYVLDILPAERIRAALMEFRRVLRPGGRLVLVNATFAARRRHRLPELLYGSRLPLTSNCRAIRVAPLLVELGFVNVTRCYVSQIGLPSELVSATNGPCDRTSASTIGERRGNARRAPRPSAPS